jgi:hypothetical protein
MRLGFTEEAAGLMTWLEARCHEAPDDRGLQVLYVIDGNPRCQNPWWFISTATRAPGPSAWATRPPGSRIDGGDIVHSQMGTLSAYVRTRRNPPRDR